MELFSRGGEWAKPKLQPYLEAMLGASGITLFQAKTALYYGLASFHLDKFDIIPLLVFLGDSGTGKSQAIKQLLNIMGLDCERDTIVANTYSDLAQKLNGKRFAVIEEADKLQPQKRCEELLQNRTTKALATQTVYMPPTQIPLTVDIWGATILHKRQSFADIATRNRSIIPS